MKFLHIAHNEDGYERELLLPVSRIAGIAPEYTNKDGAKLTESGRAVISVLDQDAPLYVDNFGVVLAALKGAECLIDGLDVFKCPDYKLSREDMAKAQEQASIDAKAFGVGYVHARYGALRPDEVTMYRQDATTLGVAAPLMPMAGPGGLVSRRNYQDVARLYWKSETIPLDGYTLTECRFTKCDFRFYDDLYLKDCIMDDDSLRNFRNMIDPARQHVAITTKRQADADDILVSASMTGVFSRQNSALNTADSVGAGDTEDFHLWRIGAVWRCRATNMLAEVVSVNNGNVRYAFQSGERFAELSCGEFKRDFAFTGKNNKRV